MLQKSANKRKIRRRNEKNNWFFLKKKFEMLKKVIIIFLKKRLESENKRLIHTPRWGSFAASGRPFAMCLPATTQLLLAWAVSSKPAYRRKSSLNSFIVGESVLYVMIFIHASFTDVTIGSLRRKKQHCIRVLADSLT